MEEFVNDLLGGNFTNIGEKNLKAGFPIYYEDDKYPDYTVKEYPDGRKELVDYNFEKDESVKIRDL